MNNNSNKRKKDGTITQFFTSKKTLIAEKNEVKNVKEEHALSNNNDDDDLVKLDLENLLEESSWKDVLKEEFGKEYFKSLNAFVSNEFKTQKCFPERKFIFRCFNELPIENVKCVILGQDPYHDTSQAMGFCFSVQKGIKVPSSLHNIYKELKSDLACKIPTHGDLSKWVKEGGVLMLNTSLTVRAHSANSHAKKGWETLTDKVILELSKKRTNIVFMLWGKNAQEKQKLIESSGNEHLVLKSPHPSGLSAHRGFFGNKHFSQANAYLRKHSCEPIDWQIESETYRS